MKLQVKFFEELTTRELYEIVRSRTEIFLLEQHIICQDFDRVDYEELNGQPGLDDAWKYVSDGEK